MSHVYAYASAPLCTSIIKFLILSILNKYTLSYLHNISIITLHVKLSQGSDLSLRQHTNLLQRNNKLIVTTTNLAAVKNLNNLGFSNPSQLIMGKTSLAAASTLCFSKQSVKTKTQLTVHNSSFPVLARIPRATTSTLNVKSSLTRACSLQQ